MSAIGSRILRRDARQRAEGTAQYTSDLAVPGMLHGVLVRSTLASGRLLAVDTAAAQAVPGVVRILTAGDVTDRCYGNYVADQPILARDFVRCVGEPVAIVAATTLRAARKAAALVKVEIAPLPFVLDVEKAAGPDAPCVHPGRDNILDRARIARGDVDKQFADAHAVVRTRIESHRVHQGYLEPRVVTAAPTLDGGLSIVMSTQQPFGVRMGMAELFGIPMNLVDVRLPAIGGGFGGKLHYGYAPQACAMALATGRPVQILCERDEDMSNGNPRENAVVELESAVTREGRILARRCRLLLDSGAYAFDTPILNSMAAFYATGPYAIEAVEIEAKAVYTHTCPTGSFRGPTGPQMVFAVESHMDDIAGHVGKSSEDIRRLNFIRKGDRGPTGELRTRETTVEQCMDAVLERLDAYRRSAPASDGRRRGYGFACAWWSTLGTPSSATVEVHEDGSATISSGGAEIGTGVFSMTLPQIVADALGIPAERVAIRHGDTREAAFESGTRGSRTLFSNGNATVRAVASVVEMIKAEASLLLEAPAQQIVLQGGRVEVCGSPQRGRSLAEVVVSAKMRTGPVVATGRYRAELAPIEGATLENARFARLGEATFHCHGVEIALDAETGRVEVLRYVAAHEVGRVLNPVGARSQVEGGIAQGIGYSLTESLQMDAQGRIRNGNLHDYRMPTMDDLPREMETIFLETQPSATGPLGAKGIGEPPTILPAAAIGAALRDILGHQPMKLPFDATSLAAYLSSDGGAARC